MQNASEQSIQNHNFYQQSKVRHTILPEGVEDLSIIACNAGLVSQLTPLTELFLHPKQTTLRYIIIASEKIVTDEVTIKSQIKSLN